MVADVHIFGIRHHGPGSARRLVDALDDLKPVVLLIEGPSDTSDLLPMLADPAMIPPVALLAYPADDPSRAVFWPFAAYSPEYQAVCWAVRHGAPVRFIDLPASWTFAEPEDDADTPPVDEVDDPTTVRLEHDPIGLLAEAGGYEDGESWWRDVIEENPAAGPVFAAVADAMAVLRESAPEPVGREAAREAHMRLEIARAAKEAGGPIAVVCGAWHEPALKVATPAAADRERIKGGPKRKVAATWAPWTSPRLAFQSGYGAGVASPGWCAHLWETPRDAQAGRWLAKVAAALRANGHLVSTASLIETQRLAVALSAIRNRPTVGFEELREASIACLCFGERLLWDTVAPALLLGDSVGQVPPNVPLAPLIDDLQREQRRTRLKPEALDRELPLDLRSESGLDRSTLLHRLNLLGVPWGRLVEGARGRGTFRERWILRWEPEFAVRLVENLVFGATIAKAAAGRLQLDFDKADDLKALCELTLRALTAQLPEAGGVGIERIEQRAARTSDGGELLASLPPLGDVVRYGEARRTDAARLAALFIRILVQGALVLPYAARGLDDEGGARLRTQILAADAAVALVEVGEDERNGWRNALQAVVDDSQATPLVAGAAMRLLYEAGVVTPESAAEHLERMLSPGRPVAEAAGFFEGFFEGAGERLIHDRGLRSTVDTWLLALDDATFTSYLPLFRRAFANLDRMQRRRLLDAVFGRETPGLAGRVLIPDAETAWPEHFARLTEILRGGRVDE